jgi:radical SAM superfamily enzyme YgiQ (UPF0313 family)
MDESKIIPDILLIMAPPWDLQCPPAGIAYLAGAVKAAGMTAEILDLNTRLFADLCHSELGSFSDHHVINTSPPEVVAARLFSQAGDLLDGYIDRIMHSGATVAGFSVHRGNVAFTERFARRLRRRVPGLQILYGGPEMVPARVSGAMEGFAADAFVLGEGEKTLVDALKGFKADGHFSEMPGMVVRESGTLSMFVPRITRGLDELAPPDFSGFEMRTYRPPEDQPLLPILFSRGCSHRCAFCTDCLASGKFRRRSPESVAAEIESHVHERGVRRFCFNDLTVSADPKALRELCELLIERKLDIRWWANASIEKRLDRPLFELMRKAGCDQLVFGIDSGSDAVLKGMRKHYNSTTAGAVISAVHEAGIETSVNFIVGFPGENETEFQQTLDFIRRYRGAITRVTQAAVLSLVPGSHLTDHAEEYGVRVGDGTWNAGQGNDFRERASRLARLVDLLRELNIPLAYAFSEPPPPEGTESAPKTDTPVPELKIEDVAFLDSADQAKGSFDPGQEMQVRIRFSTKSAPIDPLVRLQIFNNENPFRENLFVFGMNNARRGFSFGDLQPGEHEVRLAIESLDLLPGNYRVAIGFWPEEEASEPFDHRFCAYSFAVSGESDGTVVDLPSSWEVIESSSGAVEENRIEAFEVPSDTVESGSSFIVELDVETVEAATIGIEIKSGRVAIARSMGMAIGPGKRRIRCTLDSVNLLEGLYELRAFPNNEPLGQFKVASKPDMGGGLAVLSTKWERS